MKPMLLLLEDEPTSRAFLAAALDDLPVEVDVAASVARGQALAVSGRHALWLFDANLPDGTGSGLLAALRRRGLTTPAIAHTASADRGERDRLLADGFQAVVVKPLPAAAWQEAIRTALGLTAIAPPLAEVAGRYHAAGPPAWDDDAAIVALGGNRDNLVALRELFLAELPAARDEVVTAVRRRDDAALLSALHRLRAGCGFVGAARLDATVQALRMSPRCPGHLQAFIDAAHAIVPRRPARVP